MTAPTKSVGQEPFIISRIDQLQAMASPHRLEILTSLEGSGPCSIPDLAEQLGRSPDSLYYHIKKMLDVGLLFQAGTREKRGHRETVFDLPGRPVRIRHDISDRDASAALNQALAAVLRVTRRSFSRAVGSESAVLDGEERNIFATRVKGWLDENQRGEVLALMDRIAAIMGKAGASHDDSTLFAGTLVFTPEKTGGREG